MLCPLTSLTNCTITAWSDTEACLIRSEVHLLFLRSLKERPRCTGTIAEIWLVPTISDLLDNRWLSILNKHLLISSLHLAGIYFHVCYCHSLFTIGRAARIQNSRLCTLLLILDSLMLLGHLHLRDGRGLHASLADLVIIIILHVVWLQSLIRLITLWCLLLNVIVLQVCVLYNYLFAFLFNYLLLWFLLCLRLILQLHSMKSSMPFLLLHWDSLFLLRRTLIKIFIVILVIKETLQGLH